MKLKTIIVEDEKTSQMWLTAILQKHCSDSVEVVDITATVEQSIKSIRENKPQLVFLDIALGENDDGAFDILKSLGSIDFKIVFTTGFITPENLLRAINKYNAVKYLVKILDENEVVDAVKCVIDELGAMSQDVEMATIKEKPEEYERNNTPEILRIPQRNGFLCFPSDEVIMLKSDGNSTIVFTETKKPLTSSKGLKYFGEVLLPNKKFIRVSKSYIINIFHVISFSTEDGGTIFLTNDNWAPLSPNYKDVFFEAFNG